MVEVSIIGAGSVAFSTSLVRDLSVTRSLLGSTVVLMDIDKERLNMVRDLAVRYKDLRKICEYYFTFFSLAMNSSDSSRTHRDSLVIKPMATRSAPSR